MLKLAIKDYYNNLVEDWNTRQCRKKIRKHVNKDTLCLNPLICTDKPQKIGMRRALGLFGKKKNCKVDFPALFRYAEKLQKLHQQKGKDISTREAREDVFNAITGKGGPISGNELKTSMVTPQWPTAGSSYEYKPSLNTQSIWNSENLVNAVYHTENPEKLVAQKPVKQSKKKTTKKSSKKKTGKRKRN